MSTSCPDSTRVRQRHTWLQQVLGTVDFTLERASHDAGFRSYWRAHDGTRSLIVMDAPPDLEPVAPWLRIHALLDAGGVRVPHIMAGDSEQGFLLLEDLGPNTCLDLMTPATADSLIRAAIEQLVCLQTIPPPPDLPHYDTALLWRDVHLFDEWFLRQHLAITLDEMKMRQLVESYHFLIACALAQPQILVHRDFMSRNLLPAGERLAVIDFQGAVRGPLAYDLMSLTKDAFISWEDSEIERWNRHYHQRARAAGLPVPEWTQFQRDLDLIGVHRHLKVLGIFSRLAHRDGKPHYIADAPRFAAYLEAVVPHYPELAILDELLALHILPFLESRA